MFGASEDPLHALVLERGRRAIADGGSPCARGRWARRAGAGRPGDRARRSERRTRRRFSRSTRATTNGREPAALEFYQLGFDHVFEISAEHGEGIGDLLDAIVESWVRRRGTSDRGSTERTAKARREPRIRRSRCRGRRAAERGQVVAGQSVAARRADDRQRDAGDDARRGGHGDDVAPAPVPDRRHRGHSPGRAVSRGRAGGDAQRPAGAARD